MNDAVVACSILRAAESHCRAPLVPENQQSTGDPAKYWTQPRTVCGLFSQQMINQRLGKRRQGRLAASADLEVTLGPAVLHFNDRQWLTPGQFHRLTYRQFIALAAKVFGTKGDYKILKQWQLSLAGLVNKTARGAAELLPRYRVDNIFDSSKFKARFPEFRVTSYREGLERIRDEQRAGV